MLFQNTTNEYWNVINFCACPACYGFRCLHYRPRCMENPKGMFGSYFFVFKPLLDFEELTFYFLAVFLSRVIYKCHQVNRPDYLNIFIRKLQHTKKYPIAN